MEGESLLLECGKVTNLLSCLILPDPLFQCTVVVVVVWIEGLVDPTGSTIIDFSVIGTLQGSYLCRSSSPFSSFLYFSPIQLLFLGRTGLPDTIISVWEGDLFGSREPIGYRFDVSIANFADVSAVA